MIQNDFLYDVVLIRKVGVRIMLNPTIFKVIFEAGKKALTNERVQKVIIGTASVIVASGTGYVIGKNKGFENGHKDGFETGSNIAYKQGCFDTAKKFNESVEHHIIRVASGIALALYIGNLDGAWSENDDKAIKEVFGDLHFQEEYVQKEVLMVYQTKPNFEQIKSLYLEKMKYEELNETDEIIRNILFACGDKPTKEEELFYNNQWMPYYESRK